MPSLYKQLSYSDFQLRYSDITMYSQIYMSDRKILIQLHDAISYL